MADDNYTVSEYSYTVEVTYLNIYNNTSTVIKNECIRSIIVDHDYNKHCMPIVYLIGRLDKQLLDDMIIHSNTNLIIISVYKYDDLQDSPSEILYFRKKFTYFIPNSVNAMDPIDYNETTMSQNDGDTYGEATMGLIAVDHITNNKKHCQLNVRNTSNYDCVKYITSHLDNILIEPFTYSHDFDQLIMPPKDSINKALEWLNDNKVFYNTPYRFYMDFNYAYLISSSGRVVENRDETYSSILISIKDITEDDANEVGVITNNTSETYEVPVNYINVQVYDNTIVNKSRNTIYGITSTGVQSAKLNTSADYLSDQVLSVRINNDNENMMYNLEHEANSQQIMLTITKTGLDSTLFTINKKITVKFIERYNNYDGNYILIRKRDAFLREDESFVLLTILTLRKLEKEESI